MSSQRKCFKIANKRQSVLQWVDDHLLQSQEQTNYGSTSAKYSKSNKLLKSSNLRRSWKASTIQFDISIFNNNNNNNNIHNCIKYDQIKCESIIRLSTALKYYSSLDIINNEQHQNDFNGFVNCVYGELLNDYNHLISQHGQQLNEISKPFIQCDITKCNFTTRHHHDADNKTIITDPTFNFYKETMDSLHFYLFHLFDCGMRVIKINDNDVPIPSDNNKNDEYFDAVFYRMNKLISETKHITKSFNRFNRFKNNNNKFSMTMNKTNKLDDANEVNNDDTTYLDEMYKYLASTGVKHVYIFKMKQYVESEEYDSESLEYDTALATNCGNFYKHIGNKYCMISIQEFIKQFHVSSSSFSIGLRFYYWKYYESLKQTPAHEQIAFNENDHSGYDICDLFVQQKYASFKQEISNYKQINMRQYKEHVVTKAKQYQNSAIVRATKAVGVYGGIPKHYNIPFGKKLGFQNLISLILYTDFTNLSTEFTSTFRKKGPFETLNSIKKRNSKYWWLSKILRETVEIYGACRHGDYEKWFTRRVNQLYGPFYCGMPSVMNIPEFNIRLCSPTSTSPTLEVALKFSGDEGIVIQLNNPHTWQYQSLRAFNCSWISRYKEEDERLFFGGYYRIKIESIRIRKSKRNFKNFIYLMYYLDVMISGGTAMKDMKMTNETKNVSIITNLINKRLGKDTTQTFDEYIHSTFECFSQNKQQIVLDLDQLKYANNKVRNLLMYPLVETFMLKLNIDVRTLTNLFRPEVFELFNNIQKVIMQTTDIHGLSSYPVSILALLSMLSKLRKSRTLAKVTIKAVRREGRHSWISALWSRSSTTIKNEYLTNNYIISFKQTLTQDWLQIVNK